MATQTIVKKGPTLPPITPQGGPASFEEVSFTLREMPEGDWHLRAMTDRGLEVPAQSLALNPETLAITATFANYFDVPVTITGYTVRQA